MTETVEPGEAEQAFARRIAEAKATVPHIYLEAEVAVADSPTTAALIAAAAAALREFPRVNGSYRDGRYELREAVNIAVAVAAQGTALFPVVRDADGKEPATIERELAALAERARSGELTQPELSGATFSLWDLRPDGIARATGVVRRGQAAQLCVGADESGHLTLTLACDARIVHGPEGARFLGALRAALTEDEAGTR